MKNIYSSHSLTKNNLVLSKSINFYRVCIAFMIVCLYTTLFAQENCSTAQYLGSVSGTYSGTTVGAANDIATCRTGFPDKVFYFSVANGATIDIWEPSNGYDEWEYVGYGATCPGTQIQCWDNDGLAHTIWTNTTGSTQNVWWIQDAYSGSGTFNLQWTITLPAAGENCGNAQNLGALSNPFSGTTVGYADDISTCRTGYPDRIFYLDVANCYTLDIWESTNNYDEWEYVGYGSSCPGTQIQCWDNDGLAHTVWNNNTGSTQRVWYIQDAYSGSGTFTLNWSVTCAAPAQPSAISGTSNPIPGSSQTYSVTNVSGVSYNWTVPSGWTITSGNGTNSINVTVGTTNGNISVTPQSCCGTNGTAQTLTTNIPAYRAQFISSSLGSSNWCAGETRTVSVTIKNTGTATWNSAYTTNVGLKWNTNGGIWNDYHVRVNAGVLASGQQQTYNLSIQAKDATSGPTYGGNLAAGSNNLSFDVVNEGNCWFANNSGSCGPGNSVYTSAAQTIQSLSVAPTGISGSTNICQGQSTTLTVSGGSAGSGATVQWFTGSCGGTSAGTGNSIAVSPSTNTTYYVRYSGTCNTTTCASTTVNVSASPGPGSNVWNVMCYNDNNFTNYYGYYTEDRMGFDSYYRWSPGGPPSGANALTGNAYSGCAIGSDNHSYIYSRTGFPSGTYSISVNRDDDSELKINGTSVYNTAGWNFFANVWTGTLNSGSTVEYRVREYGGNSYGGLVFNYVTVPSSGSNSVSCGTNVTLMDHQGICTNNGTNYSDNVNGYTVLNNTLGSSTTISISGSFYLESCCDRINIYDGSGTGGSLLASYGSAGTGTFSYTGAAAQTLTVQFVSDVSVNNYGFIADVVYNGDCAPANNNCANAINISSLPYTSGIIDNAYATDDYTTSTCDGPYKNVWWRVTGVCGTMTAITCTGNTNFDDEISVFTGSCGSFTQVACNDDNGAGCTSNYAGVSWASTAGTVYYISVGSYYNAGSTGNLQLQVTGSDVTAPILSSPGNQSLNTPSNSCTASYTIADPISDNCTSTWGYNTTGATILSASGIADGSSSGSLSFNKGVTTVTLTGTDGTNSATTVSFTITVTDNLVPTISGCPSNITVNTNAGTCTGTATWTTPTWTDNCLTPPTISGATYLGTTGGNYYYFVSSSGITWTAAKADAIAKGGRLATIETATENSFVATALGSNFPVWLGYSDDVSQGGSEGNFVSITGVPLSYGNTPSNSYGAYNNWNGGEPNNAGGENFVNMNAGGSWNDLPNSYGSIVGYVLEYGLFQTGGLLKNSTNYPLGVTTNTYNAYDFAGNTSATCSFTVTVTDNIIPAISWGGGTQTINTNSSCQVTVPNYTSSGSITKSDNCTASGSITVTQSPAASTVLSGVGSTTVTLTATDGSGNQGTTTFTLNRTDVTNPTISWGGGTQTINTDASCNATVPNYTSSGSITKSDNCTASGSINVTQSPTAGTVLNGLGSTTVTLTATDASGNQGTTTFTLNRTDVTNPTISWGGGTQTINTDASCNATMPNYTSSGSITKSDNCTASGSITVTQSPTAGTILNGTGSTTVTLTATDASGNQGTTTFTLNRTDAINPTISWSGGTQTINTNASCQVTVPNYTASGSITKSDNCTASGSITVTQSPAAGAVLSGVGSTTVTLTATDGSGNQGTTTFTLNRTDATPPTFTCPAAQNVNLSSSACQITVPNVISGLTGTDNCGTVTFTQSPVAGTVLSSSHNQTHNVTVTANDGNGNTTPCTVVLTSKDVTNPTMTFGISGTQNVNANTGVCTYTKTGSSWDPTGDNDNCGVVSRTWVLTGASTGSGISSVNNVVFNSGTTTVTWTAVDAAGNQFVYVYTVVVSDAESPTITTCPANQTVLVSANCQATIPNYATLATTPSTDNCTSAGSLVFSQSPLAGSYASYGTNVVTITVKDAANNQVSCNTNFIYTAPTDLVGANSSNTCVYAGLGTGDKYLVDASTNEALISINEGSVNLGTVTASVIKHGSVPTIAGSQQCDAPLPSVGPVGGDEMYLPREFDVTTTATYPLSTPVSVSLYFTQAELTALSNATIAASAAYQNCWGTVASNGSNLMLTIHHSDGSYETRTQGGGLTLTSNAGPNNSYKATFQVNRFSGFLFHGNGGVNGPNGLPVEFLYFEAHDVNNSFIQLTWATALEINNDGFEVERSVDGNNWTTLGWVDGNDNSTVQQNYSYNDYTAVPNVRYYYRLKQIDNDGQFEYSTIDDAMITNSVDFTISEFIPNPTTAQTQLNITTADETEVSITVYDLLGQKVTETKRQLSKGANQVDFNFGQLAAGNYTAAINAGNNFYTKRLLITR